MYLHIISRYNLLLRPEWWAIIHMKYLHKQCMLHLTSHKRFSTSTDTLKFRVQQVRYNTIVKH